MPSSRPTQVRSLTVEAALIPLTALITLFAVTGLSLIVFRYVGSWLKLSDKSIGALMFTDFVYPFELASLVLLVGMIAAIVLTHRGPKATKYTNPNQQVFVKAKDRVRVLQMPVEKD